MSTTTDRLQVAWVSLFSALFVAAIGIETGGSNHVVYLLPGMHMADPGFLANDWFVTATEHSHRTFAWIVNAIARSGFLEAGLAIGTILQSAGLALALWFLVRQLYEKPLLPWTMALMLLAATHTRGVGLNWLVMPEFEASSLAGVAVVSGLGLLASGRSDWFAGLAFGLAALLHPNYAVLVVPLAGAAAIVIARRRGIWRALALLLVLLAVGSPSYLQVSSYLLQPSSELAGQLRLARFPHHLDPTTWGPVQGSLFLAAVLAGGAGLVLRRPTGRWAFLAAAGTLVAMVSGSLVVGYLGLSDTVNQVFAWRLASIVILLSFVAISAAAFAPPPEGWRQRGLAIASFVVGLAGSLGAMFVTTGGARRVAVAAVVSLVCAARAGWIRGPGRVPSSADRSAMGHPPATTSARGPSLTIALCLLLLGFVPSVWEGIQRSHLDIRPETESRAALYSWAREHTPSEALFAIPPGWSDFRLVVGRPVVVDQKAVPTKPEDVFEWHRRIEATTGQPSLPDAAVVDSAFFAIDCSRIEDIRVKYDIDFVLRLEGTPPCGRAVATSDGVAIVDVSVTPGS